jgi:AAA domain-containing protein/bifunctional DNA primase/polymerase-like protein
MKKDARALVSASRGAAERMGFDMTTLQNQVAECHQFYNDPEEERFNELMTEENWELLKKLPNSLRLVVDNTSAAVRKAVALIPNKAEIATPQQLAGLRIKMLGNGYHPVPVVGAHVDTPSAGKKPTMPGWQTTCATANQEEVAKWSRSQPNCTNTGILCGEIVGVDIDVLDDVLSAKLTARAQELFGPTSLRRIGRDPKMLLVYRVEIPHSKLTSPELISGDDVDDKDAKAKVEILAQGQQFVGFGIHPDTCAYYRWPDKSPLDVPVSDVPLVTVELLQQFVAEAEQILRAAGRRTKAEIATKAIAPTLHAPALSIGQQAAALVKVPPGVAKVSATTEPSFFKNVNQLAYVNLASWVPALFGGAAKLQSGTGAYRITSKDLGRDLEEDLSISPLGIKDWGLWDQGDRHEGKRSPIDLVAQYKSTADSIYVETSVAEAALWLCEQMKMPPAALGWSPGDAASAPSTPTGPLIVSSAGFLAGFVPPDYLIDGILQRRFCYSFTAPTGSGKTAIALLLSVHVALGRSIGEAFVERGRVLYLAGENPDDIRMRWLAAARKLDFDSETIDVHFLPGVFKISEIYPRIHAEVTKIGPVALVVVDTSAAYFEGDDENGNVQMGTHARRLRSLVSLPGEPCVLVACHPVKNAAADNMVPKGGGSFLNEVDGNLTGAKTDSVVTLHWQGKYRGPDFAPIPFQLHTVTTDQLKDSKGRLIPSVVALPLSEDERGEADANSRRDEDNLLVTINGGGRRSMADLALVLGWLTNNGKPYKARVQRAADRLKKGKLVKLERNTLVLTPAGKKEAERVRNL